MNNGTDSKYERELPVQSGKGDADGQTLFRDGDSSSHRASVADSEKLLREVLEQVGEAELGTDLHERILAALRRRAAGAAAPGAKELARLKRALKGYGKNPEECMDGPLGACVSHMAYEELTEQLQAAGWRYDDEAEKWCPPAPAVVPPEADRELVERLEEMAEVCDVSCSDDQPDCTNILREAAAALRRRA